MAKLARVVQAAKQARAARVAMEGKTGWPRMCTEGIPICMFRSKLSDAQIFHTCPAIPDTSLTEAHLRLRTHIKIKQYFIRNCNSRDIEEPTGSTYLPDRNPILAAY